VVGLPELVLAAQVVVLLGGFGYAAASDLRSREVTDRLWQVMGGLGLVLGAVLIAPGGWIPLVLWLVVAAFTLQHMFDWTLGERFEGYENVIDLVLYVAVVVLILIAVLRVGIGSSGVPYPVIALLVTVLFARGAFETGLLFGGADAKAVMIAGALVPIFATPLLYAPSSLLPVTAILPFAVNLLMDAALLTAAIPIAIVLRNVVGRHLSGWRSFTGYPIPVRELPDRFVWVRNPLSAEGRAEEEEIETSEQDRQRRVRIAAELTAKGQTEIWVTPQIPYLVPLALGAVAALLAGNLVVDLITLL
jgi:archaeal preflagellin peptidase FlaK